MYEQAVTRRDSWTVRDDNILAETVLRHIREGSTQLKAFEEVGVRLERTASACGFRWNATVRKDYEDQIKQAKKLKINVQPRVQIELRHEEEAETAHAADNIPEVLPATTELDAIAEIARRQKTSFQNMSLEISKLRNELEASRREIDRLNEMLSREKPVEVVSEDYQTFLKILENARKLKVL